MLLEVRHVTQYHYAERVRESVMELWMQPQKSATQRLLSFELETDPAAQLFSYADSFGNAVYHFDVPQPHDQLEITARSMIILTFGGGTNEIQRDLIAIFGLGMPRSLR